MKRLYLSSSDKKIAGICGGLSEYFEVDPTIIRLLTVVLAVVTGFFPLLIGYLIAWIIIPKKPVETPPQA